MNRFQKAAAFEAKMAAAIAREEAQGDFSHRQAVEAHAEAMKAAQADWRYLEDHEIPDTEDDDGWGDASGPVLGDI